MPPLFAMAGLAEAAWAQMLGLLCLGLLIVTVTAVFGLFFRSRVTLLAALALTLAVSACFTPWEAFRPIEGNDPDAVALMGDFRTLAVWWVVVSAATVIALVVVLLRTENGEPD
jgi:hypothetical protein